MKAITPHDAASSRGFSLMELLVVVAIMAVLAAVAVPALTGNNNAANLTSAAQRLADEMRLAQQTATTRNLPVEVRLYLLPDPNKASDKMYRGFQSFLVNDDGTYQTLTKASFLPTGITTNTSAAYSTLITEFTPLTSTFSVPTVGTTYQYVAFQFRSDGSTNLASAPASGGAWCITLEPQREKEGATPGLKANYATLQIDPLIGRVKVIRP